MFDHGNYSFSSDAVLLHKMIILKPLLYEFYVCWVKYSNGYSCLVSGNIGTGINVKTSPVNQRFINRDILLPHNVFDSPAILYSKTSRYL